MKKLPLFLAKLAVSAVGLGLVVIGAAAPAYATDEIQPRSEEVQPATEPQPSNEVQPAADTQPTDTIALPFGDNLLAIGNGTSLDETTVRGLLFGLGGQVQLPGTVRSHYTFLAGSIIQYSAVSERDLFVAGVSVDLNRGAQIGGDVYAAGESINVHTDLSGNLSALATQITIRDSKIDGDLNLMVSQLIFEGEVTIGGKININEDAVISGIENAKYATVATYEHATHEVTASEIWASKVYSIVAIFIAFAIIMIIYSRINQKVERHLTAADFGRDVLTGAVLIVLTPVVIFFLLLTIIGAPAAIVLLVIYLVVVYLARGFAGLWFGKLVVEKIVKSHTNSFVEALLGITLLACISLIPVIGWIVELWSMALGCGLIFHTVKPSRKGIIFNAGGQPTSRSTDQPTNQSHTSATDQPGDSQEKPKKELTAKTVANNKANESSSARKADKSTGADKSAKKSDKTRTS